MKYCSHCGSQVHDEAVVCVKCGCSLETKMQPVVKTNDTKDTLQLVVKIFLIISCVGQGFAIFPLAWCLPITIMIFNRFRDHRPIGTGLKICTLLFVNLISGVCLLCMNEDI